MTVLAFKKVGSDKTNPAAIVVRRKSDNTVDMTLVEGGDPVVNDAIAAFDVLINLAGSLEGFIAKQTAEVNDLAELIESRKNDADWKVKVKDKKDEKDKN